MAGNKPKITKEAYEIKIAELADDFFRIPKKENSLASKRDTLKGRLWTSLWWYYKEIQYNKVESDGELIIEKYSGVINNTIARSMEAYKIEKETVFLHYVNAAVKKEISRERQKSYLCGLKVPPKILRQWKLLDQLAHSRGIDSSDINKMGKLGSILGYSEKELEQVLDFGKVKICSDQTEIGGKESSLFDHLKSDLANPEEEFEKKEEIKIAIHQFQIIDDFFKKKQERIKPYLSALLTLEFFPALNILNKIIINKHKFTFFDFELYAELENIDGKRMKKPTQQEIAARFKRDKTDASRTLNSFLKEVQQKVSTG